MDIPLPQSPADALPFAAAAFTLLVGLLGLFMPRVMLRALRMEAPVPQPQAVAEMRSTIGGFLIGLGVLALLLYDQPVVQMMLGGGWAFAAFGRLVALLSDGVSRPRNVALLLLALLVAAAPLAAAFGFLAP